MRRKNSKIIISISAMILISGFLPVPAALPGGVSIHLLDNGMEVLLIRNPGLPMTGANVAVKAGSAYETFATSGMSHMLEHLLFNGTASRSQKELYDETDRIGGYNNANTSAFYTNYMMVTPTEHFKKGLELQADMLFNSILPPGKFEKEKGIVLEEISKSLSEPREQFERNIASVIYRGHPLSLPTLGTFSTIQAMTRDDVYSYYKNNYVPNNIILSVVGDFENVKMLEIIKKAYGSFRPANVSRPERDGRGEPSGTFHRSYPGKDTVLSHFFRLTGNPGPVESRILESILEKESKAVFGKLDEKFQGDVRDVKLILHASPFRSYIEARTTLIRDANQDRISEAAAALAGMIDTGMSGPAVMSEEMRSRTAFLQNIEKPHMFGIYNAYDLAVNGIESVLSLYDSAEFTKAADTVKNMMTGTPAVLLVQSPEPGSDGNGGQRSASTLLFSEPGKGKALIVTDNGGTNLLAVHYLLKHKAELESKYGKDIAKVLHQCFGNRMNDPEVKKFTDGFGLAFKVNDNPFIPMDDIYLHPDFGYIRVEGLADDVPGVIGILNREIQNFTPTEEDFQKALSEIKRASSPMMMANVSKKIFDMEYEAAVFEESRYTPGPGTITYENLLKFAAEYFTPANMIVSISSPMDTGTVNGLFDGFFTEESMVKTDAWTPEFGLRDRSVTIEKTGKGDRSYLFWGFTKKTDKADRAALQALSLYLSDRIVFDIREKRGMAYNMKAGIDTVRDRSLFYINMGTRPENTETLVQAFPEFFRKEVVGQLDRGELERLVNMYLGRMQFRRLSAVNRAYYYSRSLYFDNDMESDPKFFSELGQVTVEDVKAAAAKYLDGKNPLTIIIK